MQKEMLNKHILILEQLNMNSLICLELKHKNLNILWVEKKDFNDFKNKKMLLKDDLEIIKLGWLKLLIKLVMMQ